MSQKVSFPGIVIGGRLKEKSGPEVLLEVVLLTSLPFTA